MVNGGGGEVMLVESEEARRGPQEQEARSRGEGTREGAFPERAPTPVTNASRKLDTAHPHHLIFLEDASAPRPWVISLCQFFQ